MGNTASERKSDNLGKSDTRLCTLFQADRYVGQLELDESMFDHKLVVVLEDTVEFDLEARRATQASQALRHKVEV